MMIMEKYKQFRDTDYYVSKDGVVINKKTNREVKGHKTKHGYTLFKIGTTSDFVISEIKNKVVV